jgi:hypothetical protein
MNTLGIMKVIPGVISQVAGLWAAIVPSFLRGDATGFLEEPVLVESADDGDVEVALKGGGKGADGEV